MTADAAGAVPPIDGAALGEMECQHDAGPDSGRSSAGRTRGFRTATSEQNRQRCRAGHGRDRACRLLASWRSPSTSQATRPRARPCRGEGGAADPAPAELDSIDGSFEAAVEAEFEGELGPPRPLEARSRILSPCGRFSRARAARVQGASSTPHDAPATRGRLDVRPGGPGLIAGADRCCRRLERCGLRTAIHTATVDGLLSFERLADAEGRVEDLAAVALDRRKSPAVPGLLRSRPVSRILSGVTIHLGCRFPGSSCGVPGSSAGNLERSLFALHRTGFGSRRVATTLVGSYPTFSPLPPASPERSFAGGGLLSVPLSVGFRRLGFPQRPALRCPDFPRAARGPRSPGLHVQV